MSFHRVPPYRALLATGALAALAACDQPFDLDLRDTVNGFDTSQAVRDLPQRPRPDDRGVISYPNYQVVAAQRGDTVRSVAARLGLNAEELATYNGIEPDVPLRRDEIIALPRRVTEPTIASGAEANGPIRPVDITAVATTALDRTDSVTTTALPPAQTAPAPAPAPAAAPATSQAEPIRHQVQRGDTVFALARRYNVPVGTIAEWNGLDSDFTVREGQFLLIPQAGTPASARPPAPVSAPGAGTATPLPPSAAAPLPAETPSVPLPASATPAAPDIGTATPAPAASNARFIRPLSGTVIREYAPGRNEGIDIAAPGGTAVKAADAGSVAAVTTNTSGVAIVVIRHSDGLLTVYTNIDNLKVAKGDTVSRGQTIAEVRDSDPSFLHFEVRRGLESADPADYLP